MNHRLSLVRFAPALAFLVALGVLEAQTAAQDRLKTMPGYQQYQKMVLEIPGAVKLGSISLSDM